MKKIRVISGLVKEVQRDLNELGRNCIPYEILSTKILSSEKSSDNSNTNIIMVLLISDSIKPYMIDPSYPERDSRV